MNVCSQTLDFPCACIQNSHWHLSSLALASESKIIKIKQGLCILPSNKYA